MIKGEAGTGKTTMVLQMIESLSDQQPEYYLSSRVSDAALYRQFPWLRERVERNQLMRAGMAFLRRSSKREEGRRKLDLAEPHVDRCELNRLEGQIEAGELGSESEEEGPTINPDGSITLELGSMLPELEMAYDIVESNLPLRTLIVLDSIEALAENYGIPAYRIMNALQKDLVEKAGTNVIFVMETAERSHLDYLGDGIVILRNALQGEDRVRTIDIEKLRGSSIRNWRYLFTLDGGRMTVIARDVDLEGPLLPRSDEALPPDKTSLGWRELDRVFGGAPLGSLTLLEIGQRSPLGLLERIESTLVAQHLSAGRGVIWYPQRTLDLNKLPEKLGDAPLNSLHVLDTSGVEESFPFLKKMEGEDLGNDLRWDSLKYLLKGSKEPYVSILGLDALMSAYGDDVVPTLIQHVDLMRRGGHIVIIEANEGTTGSDALSHQARLHLRVGNMNGSIFLKGMKPNTIVHCLHVMDGQLSLKPML